MTEREFLERAIAERLAGIYSLKIQNNPWTPRSIKEDPLKIAEWGLRLALHHRRQPQWLQDIMDELQ